MFESISWIINNDVERYERYIKEYNPIRLWKAFGDEGCGLSALSLRKLNAVSMIGGNPNDTNFVELWSLDRRKEFENRLHLLSILDEANELATEWKPSLVWRHSQYTTTNGYQINTSNLEGKAKAVYAEITKPGNNHWGQDMDLCSIEHILRVRFMIFLPSGNLYPRPTTQNDDWIYGVIMYHDGQHFEPMLMLHPKSNATQSLFTLHDLQTFGSF